MPCQGVLSLGFGGGPGTEGLGGWQLQREERENSKSHARGLRSRNDSSLGKKIIKAQTQDHLQKTNWVWGEEWIQKQGTVGGNGHSRRGL